MEQKYFKQESKKDWYTTAAVTNGDLQTGALMRIADATELMASNYTRLQNDLNNYKRWYDEAREEKGKLYRKISALKGVITKLKTKNP